MKEIVVSFRNNFRCRNKFKKCWSSFILIEKMLMAGKAEVQQSIYLKMKRKTERNITGYLLHQMPLRIIEMYSQKSTHINLFNIIIIYFNIASFIHSTGWLASRSVGRQFKGNIHQKISHVMK